MTSLTDDEGPISGVVSAPTQGIQVVPQHLDLVPAEQATDHQIPLDKRKRCISLASESVV